MRAAACDPPPVFVGLVASVRLGDLVLSARGMKDFGASSNKWAKTAFCFAAYMQRWVLRAFALGAGAHALGWSHNSFYPRADRAFFNLSDYFSTLSLIAAAARLWR